jgi:hypothetical protein
MRLVLLRKFSTFEGTVEIWREHTSKTINCGFVSPAWYKCAFH